MFFEVEKINRLLKELDKNRFSKKKKVEQVKYMEGDYKSFSEANLNPWMLFNCGQDKWGDPDKRYWFHFEIEITDEFMDDEVWLLLKTGQEAEWDLNKNPQFLLMINNEIVQGFDINHHQCRLVKKAVVGEKYIIDFIAYSGFEEHHVDFIPSIAAFDSLSDELYFDIMVPTEIASRLHENDYRRIDMLSILNQAMNMIDFRSPYSKTYYDSLNIAKNYVYENLYYRHDKTEPITASCVGHTHIDVAWLWDLRQTKEKVVRSFSTVLKLMDEYDEYLFMSSQPQLYEFLKEAQPELYEKLKLRIKEGRWEAEGAMWVEADCNLSSGESLIRQIQYGTKFFKDEFDVTNEVLWLPDVFGYSQALPQILKQFNIPYFMTTKINWNEYNKMPNDTFLWKGLDGSSVLTHFVSATDYESENKINTFTTYNGMIDANHVMGAWQRYQQKNINQDVLICYGYGDGGGGPTREMLETGKRMNLGLPGSPKVEFKHSKPYFDSLKKQVASNPFLPVWQGELYLEYHRGTYTSMAKSKLYNRMSEQLLHELEFLASNLSMYEEYKYPQSKLDKMWKLVMLNQFHDILPGTSIEKVYVDSFEQYEEVFRIGNDLRNELLDRLLKYTGGKGLFVSNSLSFKRNDYVDVDGNLYYVEGIESYSVGTYEDKKEDLIPFSFEDGIVKTPFYKVEFNEKGNISSIYDFENNREVLKAEGNVFQVFEDKPHHYDAWDINVYYMQKSYDVRHVELTLKEKTPLRMTLRLVKHYEQSIIKQDIHFYHKNRRIDFETHIDWHEKQYLLKVAFPVDVHAESATYDVQFGNVKRPTHRNTSWDFARFEVVGHHYVDVSESTFGVSLLNNCKYGYDVFDSVLRLSLIKSATDPNPNADQGHHVFTYSLLPHTDSSLRTTIKEGYQLNYPLRGRMINHLDKNSSLSFVETDQNITIGTVKKALERDGYVIRVFDELNARTTFKLTFMKNIKHLEICNLHEECIEELPFQSNVFNDVLKPFEIKTYYVEFNHEV